MYKVNFISLEESDKDLIVSFAIEDEMLGVRSLILHRTLFFEEFLSNEERGVIVSMEEVTVEEEHRNVLNEIRIKADEIEVITAFSEYRIDISNIEKSEIEKMILLLEKQNYDDRFTIQVA